MSPVTTPASHALSESLAGAARAVCRVLEGASLSDALAGLGRTPRDSAVRDLAFGTLRDFGVGDALLARLAHRPFADLPLRALLLVALREIGVGRAAHYTIVSQAVDAADRIGLARAKGLVNGVLRNYLRRRDALDAAIDGDEAVHYRHPEWWIERLRHDEPERWVAVLATGNESPPMTLRVNRRRTSIAAYLGRLEAEGIAARSLGGSAVRLAHPRPVESLPGFAAGEVSVQDAGAQRAAELLELADGQRVLDACAAPGGKTGHILECADVELVAIDVDRARNRRVRENLARLGLSAQVVEADAADVRVWWDGRPFDRILLDAPCSASGVVRRHPDIKWLRREADIAALAERQSRLLAALWQVLAPGGRMLYATCSVFREENAARIEAFLAHFPDAIVEPVPGGNGLLPDADHDGFYYAALRKPQRQ